MRRLTGFLAMLGAVAPVAVQAQTHVVKKPETVVRAVAVFEWTGDEAKPTASRLVPVSVFIDSQLEDAGIYMARPVPFALYTGTIFEVQRSGVPEGVVQLAYERHLEGNSVTQFDDGWMGYGLFKPASQGPVYAAKKSGPLPQIVASGGNRPQLGNKTGNASSTTATADDSSRPTMRRRTDSGSSDSSGSGDASSTASTPSTSSGDSSRPTMQRRTDSSSSDTTASADSTPAKTPVTTTPASDDPNRPVLQRRSDSSDTTTSDSAASSTPSSSKTASSGSSDDPNRPTMQRRTSDSSDSTTASTPDSTDDADRPTLKKRPPPTQGKTQKRQGDQASVSSVGGSLNDDPDRPTLHRSSGDGGSVTNGIPPLNGLPADMHQRAAVSDAKDRPEHDFMRPWDSESERTDILGKMEELARARLAKYDVAAPNAAATVAAAAPAKTIAAKTKKPAVAPPPPPVALADESLRGYTLSYGGAATFVYTAASPGIGGATRYVSIVAQQEPMGEPKVALSSVTDSTHLDRTPWMRLVDVVDADASNRASLLFELRGQNARQFALYRVIGAKAEQVFQTGTTE